MSLSTVNISLYTNRLKDVVFGKEKFIIANKDGKVLRMTGELEQSFSLRELVKAQVPRLLPPTVRIL